ncbi:MAG: 50S ribosomal protein L25 [Candidatus Hydrogenedentes bacterium]|nr:50S ribosomal protein L25 [Candidatus Hydrogenedentota bacterium]
MELQTLKVATRPESGKGPASRVRRAGDVPGVLYGGGKDAVSIKVNSREFDRLVHTGGEHAVVQLSVEDSPALSSPALLKSVHHHPVRGTIIHADFQRIRLDERITTVVELEFVGQAKGLVDGGVMDFQLREVEVECLALEVPASIKVDISDLGLGDSLHVEQIQAPANVTIVTDPERSVVAVHAPRMAKTAEEEAAEAAAAEAGPEVIGESKDKDKED